MGTQGVNANNIIMTTLVQYEPQAYTETQKWGAWYISFIQLN
jgi:hypothetical protein